MLRKYNNGNAVISLFKDGTREIEYEGMLSLATPLNIDIRVMTKCSFGFNPATGTSFCSFCHESARVDGQECDYTILQQVLQNLPAGIELAIGSNQLTKRLYKFLGWATEKGYICNLTVNQGHVRRDLNLIKEAVENGLIQGLGISYRSELEWNMPDYVLDYPHTVFHTIAGIDSFEEVYNLRNKGVKKILILGEKDFGFNEGNVNLQSRKHREWFWWVHKMFSKFQVVSFDNLAVDQLNIQRFFTPENWQVFNQGEHSMYINAVEGYFAPSSRSIFKIDWNSTNINEYFKKKEINGIPKNYFHE